MTKFRLHNAVKWRIDFWAWDFPFGYSSVYYDGWNNQINLGFICIGWITPPLIGDDEPKFEIIEIESNVNEQELDALRHKCLERAEASMNKKE